MSDGVEEPFQLMVKITDDKLRNARSQDASEAVRPQFPRTGVIEYVALDVWLVIGLFGLPADDGRRPNLDDRTRFADLDG